MTPTKVIYICGASRGGTTILGRLLGSMDGHVFAGEVRHLWRGVLSGRACGCGAPHRDCELWGRVLDAELRFEGLDAGRLAQIQTEAVPLRHAWRGTRGILKAQLPAASTPRGRYARLMARLYERISAVTGGSTVVDSAKRPIEAALLSHVGDLEITVVHVIRDPRGMVLSNLTRTVEAPRERPHPRRTGYFAASWVARNRASQSVREAAGSAGTLIKHEVWVADPAATLRSAFAGTPVELAGLPLEDHHAQLRPGHAPRGNGNQRAGTVAIRREEPWRFELHPADRALTTAITLPMLLRYGYRLSL